MLIHRQNPYARHNKRRTGLREAQSCGTGQQIKAFSVFGEAYKL
jgi:hypothetical protein